jgi:natural product biosynthesis luciferase-like monooxygenase protein
MMGTESLLIQCAELLLQGGQQICGIISSEPLIIDWAREKAIPQIEPGPHLLDILSQQPFDYFFSITNLSLIPPEILALPRQGAINFHDGPLPRYAGLHATSWALINQEKMHGITWHIMSDEVDKGNILKQRHFAIAEGETAFTLNAKCYEAAIDSFSELVDELASGRVEFRQQNLVEQTYFSKYQRPPAAGTLYWNQSADNISALVRALNFGPYANPLGLPKLVVGEEVFIVPEIDVLDSTSQATPGTITAIGSDSLKVATASHEVALRKLLTIDGQPLSIADFVARFGVREGDRLAELDQETAEHLTTLNRAICQHEEFWRKRLAELAAIEIPYANHTIAAHLSSVQYATVSVPLPAEVNTLRAERDDGPNRSDFLVAAFAAYLARVSGNYTFDLGFREVALQQELAGFEHFFASHVPLRVQLDPAASSVAALDTVQAQLALMRKRKSYARDAILRYPELSSTLLPIIVEQVKCLDDYTPLSGSELTLLLSEDGLKCHWVYDTAVLDSDSIASMQRQFATFLQNIAADCNRRITESPLLTEAEHHQLLVEWNKTQVDYPKHLCIHQLVEAQVEQTPDEVAAVFEDQQLTYRQLNIRANQLGHYLRQLNVGPETRVGIYMEPSLDMIVGVLGILKAGGAYVPLDPTYPKERLAFMVEDAQVPVLLTQARFVKDLPAHQAQVVCVDADWDIISAESKENVPSGVTPKNLSYVIYTSGSTGKPKGVMVCHRNVVNFFTGMDERIAHDPPGTWLAVTSLSFDISVLELCWTLARGFKVILYSDKTQDQASTEPVSPVVNKEIEFSLFYFASDESEQGATDKYKLLLEGAKFADKYGFAAVWTPERHFHAFGGLYPNPAVVSAAIAAITERVGIRAGSCVLPLHHPIRVAEEWSLVDNISKGRVGISFASGWQPNDFVLKPENHAESKEIMVRDIEVVRKLWRGEAVNFPGPFGKDVAVRTLPRPVQAELPVWVTAAGNPETFRIAGAGGFNILTHLLGQRIEELAEKLAIYRQAWAENGHPGQGHVSLMLHTFVGEDDDEVREIVCKPMTEYLRSAVGLIKAAAWNFPTFKQRAEVTGQSPLEIFESEDLSKEDMEALLAFAFERYFETSGLFGTPSTCLKMVNKLKAIDVDEIACLIDFGVPSETVLYHLQHLNTLRELSSKKRNFEAEDYSIPALITRHRVSHMQCTPAMASMLMMNEEARAALGSLQQLMIGGEAFPVALAQELKELVSGDILNMYGPTETTIWSSIYPLNGWQDPMPIGRPIANTEIYILDRNLQPVPMGLSGELFIGGEGVVRGYLNRPELTAERFIKHLFDAKPQARLYRTGDLARYGPDGNIEFLGRMDHQVKIRGYRIELGEIETLLGQHPAVQKAVVIAREDILGDKRLVAYVIPQQRQKLAGSELRDYLKEKLPEFMIPSNFITLDAFPLTPNRKIDRKVLPAPGQVQIELETTYIPPTNELEQTIASLWQELLNVPKVGMSDNFFDMGGHSLLAVQAHRRLREVIEREISITDMFRFPTIRSLTEYLSHDSGNGGQINGQKSTDRAKARKEAIMRRQQRR